MSQQVLSAIATLHQDVLSMRAEIASLHAILATLPTNGGKDNHVEQAPVAAPSKKDKKKRVMKRDENGKPILNSWVIFTNRVRELCKDKGVENLLFCKSLKANHENYSELSDEAIRAARSSWVPPVKEAKSASETESTSSKPKKARKSKKQATEDVPSSSETVATNVTSSTTTTTTNTTSEKKKRGPKEGTKRVSKKVKEAAAKELPAPTEEEDNDTEAGDNEEPVESAIVFKGKKYWFNAGTGAVYHRGDDDARGEYKGIFNPKDPKTGKSSLDTTAPEPTA